MAERIKREDIGERFETRLPFRTPGGWGRKRRGNRGTIGYSKRRKVCGDGGDVMNEWDHFGNLLQFHLLVTSSIKCSSLYVLLRRNQRSLCTASSYLLFFYLINPVLFILFKIKTHTNGGRTEKRTK
ncbi:hypothetical protein AAHE18_02G174500 [Arachis hypogaea]